MIHFTGKGFLGAHLGEAEWWVGKRSAGGKKLLAHIIKIY